MELFVSACLLLATLVFASPLNSNKRLKREDNATLNSNISDSPFMKVIRTNDTSVRDAIYYSPAFMFVGTDDKLMRCLYEDPDECEVMLTTNRDSAISSLLVAGKHLYVGLFSGELMRCDPNKKESCKTIYNLETSVDSLAVVGQHLYVGLGNGTILRCRYQPQSCRTFHSMDSRVYSLVQVNEHIYAGLLDGNLRKCSLRIENSCIKMQEMDSYVVGAVKTGNIISTVTNGSHLWNCSLKTRDEIDSCAFVLLNYSEPRGMVSFNNVLYMPTANDGIYACKWENNTNCSRFGHFENTHSIVFTYKTFSLQSRYKNEDSTCIWQSAASCPPAVIYLNDQQRSLLEVHVKDGKLYNAFGSLLDTSDANEGRSGHVVIFAMESNGRILVSNNHENELLHTSSLFAGSPVSGAGELVVKNGVIEKMIACSKHYRPDLELNQQVIESLRAQGYAYANSIRSLRCGEEREQSLSNNTVVTTVVPPTPTTPTPRGPASQEITTEPVP